MPWSCLETLDLYHVASLLLSSLSAGFNKINQISGTQLDNENVQSQDHVGSTASQWLYCNKKRKKKKRDTEQPRHSETEWRTMRLAEVTALIVRLGWPSLASLVIGACSVITSLSRETPCSPCRAILRHRPVLVHLKRQIGLERPSMRRFSQINQQTLAWVLGKACSPD